MVRASMATRNKKSAVTRNNMDSQFKHEVKMGKFPGLHRRAILIIVVILLIIFFWPKGEEKNEPAQPPTSTQDLPVPVAPSVSSENTNQTTLPPAQDSLNADKGIGNTAESGNNNENQQTALDTAAWQTYQIKEGQTLAQLFRDNQLPVNDAFSMAKSEDQQKSLSQLHAGQTIRLQRNPQGEVSMLEVTNSAGTLITFTRLSDGSYYRTP